MSIEEGNKIIAEFDGWKFDDDEDYMWTGYFNCQKRWHISDKEFKDVCIDGFKYHSDWNRLMLVVEKIESLNDKIIKKVYITINGNTCSIWNYFDVKGILREDSELNCPFSKRHSAKTKLLATYEAVIQFLTWYNSQKQTS